MSRLSALENAQNSILGLKNDESLIYALKIPLKNPMLGLRIALKKF